MAITLGSTYPVYGQAFQCAFTIRSFADGLPLTGGLTALASTVSKDGGNFASTTTAPTEIQTSGIGYISLSATEMQADVIIVNVTCSNTNKIYDVIEIRPLRLTEASGFWIDQSKIRIEQATVFMSAFLFNYHTITASSETVKNRAGDTTILTATVSSIAGPGATRQKMT